MMGLSKKSSKPVMPSKVGPELVMDGTLSARTGRWSAPTFEFTRNGAVGTGRLEQDLGSVVSVGSQYLVQCEIDGPGSLGFDGGDMRPIKAGHNWYKIVATSPKIVVVADNERTWVKLVSVKTIR